ncbi:MAG: PRC-barrel domain-containing protein [Candidatus Gracilibacteria bacterium]
MEKLYTKILHTPVREEDEVRPITTVKDLIVDPENGAVVGVVVNLNAKLIVAPHDILSFGDTIFVHGREVIVPAEDVLRVDNVLKKGVKIFHNKVVTESGKELGIVADFSIDTKSLIMQKIFVAKSVFGLVHYDQRIIPAKNIVEVKADKIIVKDDLATVKEKEKVRVEDLAVS